MLRFLHSPIFTFLVGFVLLCTAGYETWLTWEESVIGAHHGVLLYAFTHILKTVPELAEGAWRVDEAVNEMSPD
ncbi:hypothetical protein HR060_06190 [Catenovulum sp. SM1970]|uniref:hypothetical protein n=1 Tax=Marinifaba aquimaris TaxID=2741323 RepID=UPI001574B518|nr:hypothetical protein [Marinifaba aquimaris]NTS76455.1 hypothetical protein [Marinifaba aquimaris]